MKTPAWKKVLNAVLLACGLAAGCAAHAQLAPATLVLVASPTLQGPYSRTTLIAVPADGRHFGFILNRATELKLSALFPAHAPSARVDDPVYFGGPQMNDALFVVVPRDPGEQSLQLFGGLFVTNRAAVIDRIIEQTPNEARYFAGFVAWAPGQLEAEIASGHWHLARPDATLLFRRDTGSMWEEMLRGLGIDSPPPQRAPGLIETRLEAPRV